MATLTTTAWWVLRPGAGELRPETMPAAPGPGRSILRTLYTGVSPGTERLVGLGLVPAECEAAMACRSMAGTFRLPVKYGYSLVGTGIAGELSGRRVFVMHPHQGIAEVEDAHATVLPDAVPAARATLIPNLETALNAVWDAELTERDRCIVLGGGPVGLLVCYALRACDRSAPALVEADAARARRAGALPWVGEVLTPGEVRRGAHEVAFHCTGAPEGLQAALDAVGFEGRVIDLSWYGARPVTLRLGTDFHFLRKRILASQVGAVAPSRRAAFGPRERLAEVAALLEDRALDELLGPVVPFADLPAFMHGLYRGTGGHLAPVVDHGGGAAG